jgi:hypothetical protein
MSPCSTDNANVLRLKNKSSIEGDFDASKIKTFDQIVSLPNGQNEISWLDARELEVRLGF